ncbi:hypothetical protein CNBA3050 [Cryptococcus deneoformans B-3501A]|uniref:hypothetical protein n=1 Tax=Cryptococcus deneoformans (strain B-3501A) TaxID=283643 RepID=UPI000042E34D|nr:hypothetical protein CNBA3050 [Cryptococcus neoformans var. neoformans B-3501A]EAL23658.1 hypothetical protein CNBA3050 [Cryptococcus neoformans var. neoformans B-3501A]
MRLPLDIYLDDTRSSATPSLYSPSDSEEERNSAVLTSRSQRLPTSKQRRASNVSRKRRREKSSSEDVFAVEHILARSLSKWRNPESNKYEYRYLVRWENYQPKDDTWEGRSGLMEGSKQLLEEFENRGYQPFTILASKSAASKPTMYLVRYGVVSDSILPSPLYEKVWHSASQINRVGGVPKAVVKNAIDKYEETERLEEGKGLAKEEGDEDPPTVIFHVRWRDKWKLKEEWMNYERIVFAFEEDGKQFLMKWEEKRGYVKPTKVTTVRLVEKPDNMKRPATSSHAKERQPMTEYELERLKNIEANKELMRQLGL